MSRLVTIGEPLAVFTAASTGPVRAGDHFRVGLGGAECNVAVACRRLGVDAAVVGVVGADPLGAALVRALRADDVDVVGVAVEPGGFTGVMVREMRAAGQVRVSYARAGSAGSTLAPRHLDAVPWDDVGVVHSSGVTASFGPAARAAIGAAADRVRAGGGVVSFDVNYRSLLWPNAAAARECLLPLVCAADLVLLGVAEAAVLLGHDVAEPEQVLADVAALGAAEVVLKAGEVAWALVDGRVSSLHSAAVAVLDPVGAGDAFAAGYVAEMMRAQPVDVRLATAMALGRWSVTTHGDHDGLPYADELVAWTDDDVLR